MSEKARGCYLVASYNDWCNNNDPDDTEISAARKWIERPVSAQEG